MPTVVNDFANRVLAKGIKLYAAFQADTLFRRCWGLKGVGSVSLGRTGEVEATELCQVPVGVPLVDEEQYYYSQQFSGTKRVQPMELTFNKVPFLVPGLNPNVQFNRYEWMYAYTNDSIIQFSMQLRNGWEYAWLGQVDDITDSAEENSLWSGTVKIMVNTWLIHRPVVYLPGGVVVQGGYYPWGSTNPVWGPTATTTIQSSWGTGAGVPSWYSGVLYITPSGPTNPGLTTLGQATIQENTLYGQ